MNIQVNLISGHGSLYRQRGWGKGRLRRGFTHKLCLCVRWCRAVQCDCKRPLFIGSVIEGNILEQKQTVYQFAFHLLGISILG